MSWLVYRLTGSSLLLGTVAFCSQIPAFIMSPFAGITADKHDRRKMLLVTQSLMAVEAFALAALTLTQVIQPWHIVCTSIFVGIVAAYDMPTRQAFVSQMVEDRKILGNAIALNSAQFNLARLVGPAIAGLTVAAVGEGYCFLINGISFAAVLFALAAMRLPQHVVHEDEVKPLQRVKEGAIYAYNHRPIRYLLLLMAITSFVSGIYGVMLPVLTKMVYHKESDTFGLLYSASAIGALGAGWMLAVRRNVLGLSRWIFYSSAIFNLGLVGLAFATQLWLGLLWLVVIGFGAMKHMGSTNTLIQTLVEDRVRGRVMAFYMMSFVGTMPFGSLFGGFLADHIGAMWTLLIGAGIGLCGSISYNVVLPRMRKILRPIYEHMGLLEPQTANR